VVYLSILAEGQDGEYVAIFDLKGLTMRKASNINVLNMFRVYADVRADEGIRMLSTYRERTESRVGNWLWDEALPVQRASDHLQDYRLGVLVMM
jgi:hypothetical protein